MPVGETFEGRHEDIDAVKIGLDFDNTIVSYDSLFHAVALERGLVPGDTLVSKLAVRDYLRRMDREDDWTRLQGCVYGERMSDAEAFPGVVDFLTRARSAGLEVFMVSHKTRYPYLGPRYDLHEAARAWVDRELSTADDPLLLPANVYFELTKTDKLARIERLGCDVFVDDLPEILHAPEFPVPTRPILFDPMNVHLTVADMDRVRNWRELQCLLCPNR